jgi:hypothetical protein
LPFDNSERLLASSVPWAEQASASAWQLVGRVPFTRWFVDPT